MDELISRHSGPAATSGAHSGGGTRSTLPPTGVMVQPFPQPGRRVRASMEALQFASMCPPESEGALRGLTEMPRPWDPASCSGPLRREVWSWLEQVAIWINEQHLWNVSRPGIPECWPAHPHVVHDLAVLASIRFYTGFAVTPAALEDWHRYCLPGFLERLSDRLGDGCQPGQHAPRPRVERDQMFASRRTCFGRAGRFRDDVERAAEGEHLDGSS